MVTKSKRELRHDMRLLKNKLDANYKQQASNIIFSSIESLDVFKQSSSVLLYSSLPDEVDTMQFIEKWTSSKTIYLPVVDGDNMNIARYVSRESMQKGDFGILEPIIRNTISEQEIDSIPLCIAPGMAFSPNGARLGRGKGYYDRFLAKHSIIKIGVCYDFQLIDDIPTEPTDMFMDYVVSDKVIVNVGDNCLFNINSPYNR